MCLMHGFTWNVAYNPSVVLHNMLPLTQTDGLPGLDTNEAQYTRTATNRKHMKGMPSVDGGASCVSTAR
jgi:hypothetical protein